MKEHDNIIRILKETKNALGKRDASKLKELSNQTIHTASVAQDEDNIAVAVLVYSLSKLIERGKLKNEKDFVKIYQKFGSVIDKILESLVKRDSENLKKNLKLVEISMRGVSKNLRKYVEAVFIKARINKASKIHEHGISLGKTAELLGLTSWDLASYSSKPENWDESRFSKSVKIGNRIKVVENFFG